MTLVAKPAMLAIVTDDCYRTIDTLVKIGFGPWKIYNLDSASVTECMFRGKPNASSLRVGIAETPGIVFEVIQPISGDGVHQEFLRKHGEGYFHVALDFGPGDFAARLRELQSQGFRIVQSATWRGEVKYAFFEAEKSPGLLFEVLHVPEGFAFPEPDHLYPAQGKK